MSGDASQSAATISYLWIVTDVCFDVRCLAADIRFHVRHCNYFKARENTYRCRHSPYMAHAAHAQAGSAVVRADKLTHSFMLCLNGLPSMFCRRGNDTIPFLRFVTYNWDRDQKCFTKRLV